MWTKICYCTYIMLFQFLTFFLATFLTFKIRQNILLTFNWTLQWLSQVFIQFGIVNLKYVNITIYLFWSTRTILRLCFMYFKVNIYVKIWNKIHAINPQLAIFNCMPFDMIRKITDRKNGRCISFSLSFKTQSLH